MEYEIVRSRRRTMALEVRRDGAVLVRAPWSVPRSAIEKFVSARESWVIQQQEKMAQRRVLHPEPSPEQAEHYRQMAREVLPVLVSRWSQTMGVCPAAVHITSARTRFGSCSGKNSISFSWRLMQYPPEAIEYVVVHELCHIRHHDHSAAFWAEVSRFLPDYRKRQSLLKDR